MALISNLKRLNSSSQWENIEYSQSIISGLATSLALKSDKTYVHSRGQNLLTNGTALLGNNTNFSSFTFDGQHANNSPGSFRYKRPDNGGEVTITDEFMPVEATKRYKMTVDAKSLNGVGRYYMMTVCYDVDNNSVQASHHMFRANTLTTLAQELKNNDTVVYLTSAANWDNSGTAGQNTHLRSIILWNYSNSFGYTYPALTYSRNWTGNAWDPGSINFTNNTITLRVPWAGGTVAAGTQLSNGSSGGTYKYNVMSNVTLNTTWTSYSGVMDGMDFSGGNESTKFPPGTAKIKMGWLMDYQGSVWDTAWFTNMTVSLDYQRNAERLNGYIDNDSESANTIVRRNASGDISGRFGFFSSGVANSSSANNARLDLNTTGSVFSRNIGDTNTALVVNQIHASSTGDILKVQAAGTDRLTVKRDGKVGIGISTPQTLLEILTASNTENAILIRRNNASTDSAAQIGFRLTTTSGTTEWARIRALRTDAGGSTNTDLYLDSGNSSGLNTGVLIKHTGQVLLPNTSSLSLGGQAVILNNDSRLTDTRDPKAHNHNASDINAGTIGTARLGSGTASSSSYLRGDQTWATLPVDNNWYPTTFAWTNGTSAGPTGSLTGTGMSAVSYAAIPTASATISGVITTGNQTFAGTKTFNNNIVGSISRVNSFDTRNDDNQPQWYSPSLNADFKGNSTDGLADGGTFHGVLTFRPYGSGTDFSGGPANQLGLTQNGNLYLRQSTSATAWGTWKKFLRDSDITSSDISNWNTAYGWGSHTGLYKGINWYPDWTDVANKPTTFTPASHNQDASTITTGTLSSDRIPNLSASKITSDTFDTARIPNLDASKITSGTIDVGRLPAMAITDVYTTSSQSEQLNLYAYTQKGDVCIRTDESKTYIRNAGTSETMADWTLLQTPTAAVSSVAGKTGAVTLVKGDVGLGNVDNTADANKSVSYAASAGAVAWGNVSSKPTTLTGYGITDAVPSTRTVNSKALSSNITLTAADVGAVATSGNETVAGNKTFSGTTGLTGLLSSTPGNSVAMFTHTGKNSSGAVTNEIKFGSAQGLSIPGATDAWELGYLITTSADPRNFFIRANAGNGKIQVVTDYVNAITGYRLNGTTLNASHVGARADTWVPSWTDVTSKPSTFAPASHNNSAHSETYATTADIYQVSVSRTANTVLAAPNGSAGSATFRALVANDIPALAYVPTTRTVNSKELSANITLTSSDIGSEPAFSKNTAFNKNFGTTAGTVCDGNDSRLSNTRDPNSHTHGNISNAGVVASTAVALANGDQFLFSDASNSGKVERSTITTGTSTTTFLRNDGTWNTPVGTTYDEISESEIDTGTASDKRTVTARRAKYSVNKHYSAGVIETRTSTNTKTWVGTETQYDNLSSKDANTLYFCI